MVTFASVCSGIEAASAAWEPLGWHCLWLAEIDKAANGVLAFRYPHVPNHGDLVTLAARVASGEIPPPDVLIGGTPCQPFSIAGLRGGMDDPRGALTLAFVRLVEAIDARRRLLGWPPVIVVWENVPGVLNHKQNPFGCFIGALVGEDRPLVPSGKRWTNAGYVSGPQRALAWRTLDAQYFGLAQRRRRIFVVASADSGVDTAAILFECEGLRRDIAPSRESGESFTHPIAGSLTNSGRGAPRPGDTRGQDPVIAVPQWWDGRDVAQTLDAVLAKGQTMPEKDRFPAVLHPVIVFDTTQITHPANFSNPKVGDPCHPPQAGGHPPAIAFSSKDHGGDALEECSPTPGASGHVNSHSNAGAPPAVCVTEPVTHCLKADGFDASEDGTGRGQPIVNAYGFQPRIARNGRGDTGDLSNTLQAQSGQTGKGDVAPCVAYPLINAMAVRRLMPVECERLQGFPDGWTERGRGGKVQADGPRYKQLGNSMPVPVIRWLGQRIEANL